MYAGSAGRKEARCFAGLVTVGQPAILDQDSQKTGTAKQTNTQNKYKDKHKYGQPGIKDHSPGNMGSHTEGQYITYDAVSG